MDQLFNPLIFLSYHRWPDFSQQLSPKHYQFSKVLSAVDLFPHYLE